MNRRAQFSGWAVLAFLAWCMCVNSLAISQAQTAELANLLTIPPDKAKQNLITLVQPEYPPLAKAAKIAGIVHVGIAIDEAGDVRILRLISGHPMLAPAALDAIRKWKYRPFEVDGKPTAVQTEVQVSIPENISQADIDRERKFQETYWENHREGQAALENGDLTTAEAKFSLARKAAEERGDEKWRELAGALSYLGNVKKDQNNLSAAEQLYKRSLDIRLKHVGPDDVGVAGAQEELATLYYGNRQFEKAEPLLLQAVKTYEARLDDTNLPEPRAGYGRNIALGYLALSQIALADGRSQESQDRCKQAARYAEKWAKPSDKEIITSRCGGSANNK